MKNFIYINDATRKIGRATHASFDEAQLSTPVADPNSNSLALWGALNRNPGTTVPPVDEVLTPPTQFCVFAGESPFLRVATVVIPIKCTFELLGLLLEEDPMYHRNIIADVRQLSSASQVDWQELLQFHTVIQVDATPVFSVKEVITLFSKCDISVQLSVSLIVAPYRPDPKDQQAPPPRRTGSVTHCPPCYPWLGSFGPDTHGHCRERHQHGFRNKAHSPHMFIRPG
jgi:hypothetical protein